MTTGELDNFIRDIQGVLDRRNLLERYQAHVQVGMNQDFAADLVEILKHVRAASLLVERSR